MKVYSIEVYNTTFMGKGVLNEGTHKETIHANSKAHAKRIMNEIGLVFKTNSFKEIRWLKMKIEKINTYTNEYCIRDVERTYFTGTLEECKMFMMNFMFEMIENDESLLNVFKRLADR